MHADGLNVVFKKKEESIFHLGSILLFFAFLISCAPREPAVLDEAKSLDATDACSFSSGDLIVSNSGSDAVLVLNSDGTYKNIIYNVLNSAESVYGLAWSESTHEILISVDGLDRVVAISAEDCSERYLVANPNLSGNIRGITKLTGGDILVVETNAVERFTTDGFRVTSGGWPKSLQSAGTNLSSTSSGGFILCSTTTDVVRVYDDAGTQLATKSSGVGGTTDATGCLVLNNGQIATAWSGTSDRVVIYSSDLSTTVSTFNNTAILATPGGIAERSNGNLLILDRAYHYIVEITPAGEFVKILGDGVLSTPEFIVSIP